MANVEKVDNPPQKPVPINSFASIEIFFEKSIPSIKPRIKLAITLTKRVPIGNSINCDFRNLGAIREIFKEIKNLTNAPIPPPIITNKNFIFNPK